MATDDYQQTEFEQAKYQFEHEKYLLDIVKHVSTLSTGSVILSTTLMDKVARPFQAPGFVLVSFIRMLMSLASCAGEEYRARAKSQWSS